MKLKFVIGFSGTETGDAKGTAKKAFNAKCEEPLL